MDGKGEIHSKNFEYKGKIYFTKIIFKEILNKITIMDQEN
jgi:hypothetical protein